MRDKNKNARKRCIKRYLYYAHLTCLCLMYPQEVGKARK